ncbi:DedA family protein [Williamwhitmania taraxaci]|uniref:Membrane protein DedA, SNARE-associated domain n=1 Tax=Williamwhitmania taraxaci TaxID=1640674 RepID=A0A1G6KPV3_9BACT|nr:DedA family protein [Williamwhitmania taraxaci]SDC33004.1 membrane protein DedA, SNARE-associated domain [Williamwhitmania taraxaci]
MITEIFSSVVSWYMEHINYGTITLLMAIESSFIPFPSEVIIPPAAWKAAQGDLNVYLVFFFSTLGSLIGALFNYYFALFFGRKIVYQLAESRFGKMMLLSRSGVEKAEAYFVRHGKSSTLIGRLVPGIRQLISLPAGLAKMNLKSFLLYTLIGSAVWNAILTVLGYSLYSQKALLDTYYTELSYGLLVLGVCFGIYLVYHFKKKHE